MTEQFANSAISVLTGAITSGATSLTVASATAFPTTGTFRLRIDSELMIVTAVAGAVFTVTRGAEGTTAAAHAGGAFVRAVITAGAMAQFKIDVVTATVWLPTSASNPTRLWLRADLGVTNPSGVSAWADQSGAGDANRSVAQATVGNRPTLVAADASYGGRAILSGAASSMTRVGAWSVAPVAPIAMLVIGEITVNPSAFISDGATTNMLWGNGPAGKFFSTGTQLVSVADISVPCAMMFTDDGTGGAAAANLYVTNLSTPAASGVTTFTSGTTGFDIGVGVAGVSNFTGKIAEVIVWAGIPTPTDLVNLRQYLNSVRAYGIAVS